MILVLEHSDVGSVGRLGLTLRDHGQDLDIRRVDLPADRGGAPVPNDLDDIDGVISMGGPYNVGDDLAWMAQEMSLLRAAHERRLPVVGICLGAQLLAAALGGEVGKAEQPEYGFHRVDQTPSGNTDRVLAGVPWTTMMFQMHASEVKTPPAGATVLQTSKRCKVQSFTLGVRTYGIQYHPECDLSQMQAIAHATSEELAAEGSDVAAVMKDAETHNDAYARLTDRIFLNMATVLFPVTRRIHA